MREEEGEAGVAPASVPDPEGSLLDEVEVWSSLAMATLTPLGSLMTLFLLTLAIASDILPAGVALALSLVGLEPPALSPRALQEEEGDDLGEVLLDPPLSSVLRVPPLTIAGKGEGDF
jgi:hypothetical protein